MFVRTLSIFRKSVQQHNVRSSGDPGQVKVCVSKPVSLYGGMEWRLSTVSTLRHPLHLQALAEDCA